MESFPIPEEPKKSNPLSNLEKGALVAGAILAGTAEGVAQKQTIEAPQQAITIQENPNLERENNKIINHVTELENTLKRFAKKINRKDKTTIAILSESEALRQHKFYGQNDWENIATEGAVVELGMDNERDYTIASRDRKNIRALLAERNLVTNPETGKNRSKILSVYTPVDYYFTIGAEEISPDTILLRVRRIDMKTKEVNIKEEQLPFKATSEWKHEYKRIDEIDTSIKRLIEGMMK